MIKFKMFEPTPDRVTMLWQMFESLRGKALDDDSTITQFVQGLVTPGSTHFEVHEAESLVGFVSVFRLRPWSAHVHLTLFDKMLYPRIRRLLRFAFRVMNDQGLKIIYAFVPETNLASRMFLNRMGWREDGLTRMSARVNGEFISKYMFSLTLEEVEYGLKQRDYRNETYEGGSSDSGRDHTFFVRHDQPGSGYLREVLPRGTEAVTTVELDVTGRAYAWLFERSTGSESASADGNATTSTADADELDWDGGRLATESDAWSGIERAGTDKPADE